MIDEAGQRLHLRPLQDPELFPFIQALEVALKKSPEQPGKSRRKTHSIRELSHNIGELGLVVMNDPNEVDDEQSEKPNRQDTIALVRSPGMVVEYYGKRRLHHPPVAGVFLAHEGIDDVLRRSEPPEHNRWAPDADRLDPAKNEGEIVRKVHTAIWHELRNFQKTARPPEHTANNRFHQLERELVKLFGPTGSRQPGGGGKGETPVFLRPDVQLEQATDGLRMIGRVVIQLKEDHESELPVIVALQLNSIDEQHRRLDPIAITAAFDGVEAEMIGENEWHLTLSPGAAINVTVKSAVYEPDWTVDFVPQVKPFTAEAKL